MASETLAEARASDLRSSRMAALTAAIEARNEAQKTIDQLVPRLHRYNSVSWSVLGRLLSVTPQAVQKRYGGGVR